MDMYLGWPHFRKRSMSAPRLAETIIELSLPANWSWPAWDLPQHLSCQTFP
jgi:hypothetical protein